MIMIQKQSLLIFLLCSFLFSSCGIFKKKNRLEDKAFKDLNTLIETNYIHYTWFGAKINVSLESEMGSIQANCQYRIKKDSAIWLSASKFGFEAFRALITPDSIFALNRFGKEYYAEDIAELANSYGFPGEFSILQELLVGNPWLPEDEKSDFIFETDSIMIQSLYQGFLIQHGSYTPMKQIDFSEVTDSLGRRAYVTYNDYQLYDNAFKIPYFRTYEVDDGSGQQGKAAFTFKEIEIDVPQNLPFSIPKSYSKGSL